MHLLRELVELERRYDYGLMQLELLEAQVQASLVGDSQIGSGHTIARESGYEITDRCARVLHGLLEAGADSEILTWYIHWRGQLP